MLGVVLPASAAAQMGDRDCGDFGSQAAAQEFFEANDPASDPHGLDGDADRIACENNPCPCSSGAEPEPPPPPPPPKPRGYKLERAEGGPIVAELSYVLRNHRYTRRRIKIAREGQVLVNEALPRPPRCDSRCSQFVAPYDPTDRGRSVWLRDLDADGELEIVTDMWTGGANCCTFTVIYGFRSLIGGYKPVSEVWGRATASADLAATTASSSSAWTIASSTSSPAGPVLPSRCGSGSTVPAGCR
jgi:hypothetical protein